MVLSRYVKIVSSSKWQERRQTLHSKLPFSGKNVQLLLLINIHAPTSQEQFLVVLHWFQATECQLLRSPWRIHLMTPGDGPRPRHPSCTSAQTKGGPKWEAIQVHKAHLLLDRVAPCWERLLCWEWAVVETTYWHFDNLDVIRRPHDLPNLIHPDCSLRSLRILGPNKQSTVLPICPIPKLA